MDLMAIRNSNFNAHNFMPAYSSPNSQPQARPLGYSGDLQQGQKPIGAYTGYSNFGQVSQFQFAPQHASQGIPQHSIIPQVVSQGLNQVIPQTYPNQGVDLGSIQKSSVIKLAGDGSTSPNINVASHHGKSIRSIQLFENSNNPHYPHVMHQQVNPTTKAALYDPLPSRQPVKLNIHVDSCYNFMNKRRYLSCSEEEQTPLEKFFYRESLGQYKVAKILNRTSSRRLLKNPPPIKRTKKYMLVLDIDETLVHSELIVEQSQEKPAIKKKHDNRIEFRNPNGTVDVYGVRYRPYLHEFLDRMAKLYDLAVYTASARDYADAVMNQLDPSGTMFVARLYRDNCLPISGMNIKNMLNFEGTDTVLVDNLIYSYALQMDQGIPICPFIEDEMDVELKDLAEILENLPAFDSLQALLKDMLGLDEFYDKLEQDAETSNIQVNPQLLQQNLMGNTGDRTAGTNSIKF